jgi:hypothetical protein
VDTQIYYPISQYPTTFSAHNAKKKAPAPPRYKIEKQENPGKRSPIYTLPP